MALPTGVTVIVPPIQFAPTRITSTSEATINLITTYLAPLLTGLEIVAPAGSQPNGFTFRVNADGTSTAMVMWTPVAA